MSGKAKGFAFEEKALREDLARAVRAVGVTGAAAELIVENITEKVTARVKKRAALTVDDLNRYIADEAKKYNRDLAYVYKNRGKII